MKRMLVIISYRTLRKVIAVLMLSAVLIIAAAIAHFTTWTGVPAYDSLLEDESSALEKENSKLKEIRMSILPKDNRILYEDKYRNRCSNAGGNTPADFKTYPVKEILVKGKDTKFDILSNHPSYLRPLYDPSWKGAYFRGWLYLTEKNLDARHRLFIYPFGGSSIYDFEGSLGLEGSPGVDYHRYINFLVYGFTVTGIKWYENQAILIGEPRRTGFQIVSVLQDDLLSTGIFTKDMLFQLCTPKSYEIDFIYGKVIEYAYLMKQIKENTVQSIRSDIEDNESLDRLLDENLGLKKELAYFVPLEEKPINQDKCRPVPPNFPFEMPDIATVRQKAEQLPFTVKYRNTGYRRPVYDPEWLENYKKRWCYIPRQVCSSLHRVFTIPQTPGDQVDFYGILGFHVNLGPVAPDSCNILIYNTDITGAVIYQDQIFLIGTPSRTGAEIITVKHSDLSEYQSYLISVITPDNLELDYTVLYQ